MRQTGWGTDAPAMISELEFTKRRNTKMKFNRSKVATQITVFAALLMVAGFFAGATQAQSVYSGHFTLDHSIRWGKTEIPAGEYNLTLDTLGSTPLLARVVNAKTGVNVALVSCAIVESGDGPSRLMLGRRGGQYVVHTLRLEELGESFIFDRQLASRAARQEAQQADAVPVSYAKN
jgi:hypothetical protein